MTGQRKRTDPAHKARFLYGTRCHCSCGWESATWYGKGSKHNAAQEWHTHRERCEASA